MFAWHSPVVAGAGNYTVPWIIKNFKNYASNLQMTIMLDFNKATKIVWKIAGQSKLADASAIGMSSCSALERAKLFGVHSVF